MIDLKLYRETPDFFQQGAAAKGVKLDWNRFDELDTLLRGLKHEIDELNAQRNRLSK